MMDPLDTAVQAVLDDPDTPEHYVTVNDEAALRTVLLRHLTPLVARVEAEALTEAADDSEDHCRLHHVDQPPCTCFSVTKNLRNRAAARRASREDAQ